MENNFIPYEVLLQQFKELQAKSFTLNFKSAVIPKDGEFVIKEGMFAIIFPWKEATFKQQVNFITGAGTSLVFATERLLRDDSTGLEENNVDGLHYRVAIMYASGLTIKSNQSVYSVSNGYVKFKNAHTDTSGSGNAYVYYLDKGL